MNDLKGRTALITGASRGIGAAVAKALHAEGVNLGLASRSGDDLGFEGAVARPTDVRDPEALQNLVDATAEEFGGIDILVINAGVGSYGPFLELPDKELEEMIDINVKGAIYSARAARSSAFPPPLTPTLARMHSSPAVEMSSKWRKPLS
jgi:3-oxoacyl-[acyl-carrier protein] reductase